MHAFELAVGLAAPGQYPRSQCLRSRHGSASIAKRDTFGGNAPVITLQEREAGSPASCSGVLTPSALLSNVADVDAESDAEPCGCDARGAADWP